MKRFAVLIAVMVLANISYAQKARELPSVDVKTLEGNNFNTAKIDNKGKPTIISFWATWCGPCKRELNNIADMYEDWQEETGVKLVAISIDDSRNMVKVAPYVYGQDWEYEVYVDPNGDFRRAMNVNNVPHTFLLNGKNEIIWQHNSYSEGDEYELYELVKKVAQGEDISH